jgi:DNA-binding PadR family transcriptional regulator
LLLAPDLVKYRQVIHILNIHKMSKSPPATDTSLTLSFPLDYIALGLLMAGPRHGYELYQDFADEFGSIWKAGRSKFYAVLSSLEERGCLSMTLEPQPNRPPRKVYQVTETGHAALLDWLYRPVTPLRRVRVELLAKLRLLDLLGLSDVGRLLDAQTAACQAQLERLAEAEHAEHDRLNKLVFQFRRCQIQAMLEWLEVCRASLVTGDQAGGLA